MASSRVRGLMIQFIKGEVSADDVAKAVVPFHGPWPEKTTDQAMREDVEDFVADIGPENTWRDVLWAWDYLTPTQQQQLDQARARYGV
jgi:hypothetical protein